MEPKIKKTEEIRKRNWKRKQTPVCSEETVRSRVRRVSYYFILLIVSWPIAVKSKRHRVVRKSDHCRSDSVQENTCLIDGNCYADGEVNPKVGSQRCNATSNTTAWSDIGQTPRRIRAGVGEIGIIKMRWEVGCWRGYLSGARCK